MNLFRRVSHVVWVIGLFAAPVPVRAFVETNPPPAAPAEERGWPRSATVNGNTLTIYQPQLEKWDGVHLEARSAVSIQKQSNPDPTFGTVWIEARTEVNKPEHLVLLDDMKVTRANFPTQPDAAQRLIDFLNQNVPEGTKEIALDRLESALAITQAQQKDNSLPLNNDPPRVIISDKPALLVLVDGAPALRDTQVPSVKRVINTRALLLFNQPDGKYYLYAQQHWMQADKIESTWTVANNVPQGLDSIKKSAADSKIVDLYDDKDPDAPAASGPPPVPVVYVSTLPAELIELDGKPQFAPIEGTQLLNVTNTSGDLFMDTTSQDYYVLISGRWFRSKSLSGGWAYVSNDRLPADFAKIPEQHPKGDVLVSVGGTPQAKEAVIANQIPQTAQVKRSEAKLSVSYDGAPQFRPIDGTQMQYAANTPTPVIQTSPQAFYAVENGVWFTASSAGGPWTVATTVPPEIYSIPPSSPVHHVTYVQTYNATPEVVYVGYTPGYYGAYVAPTGCVVYGTGYVYTPYVGAVWCGAPATYGFGAGFGTGAALGFGVGMAVGACCHPWWGPVGWGCSHGYGWGGYGGWGGYNHWGNTNFNNVNVYNHWGNNVVNNNQWNNNNWSRNNWNTNNWNNRNDNWRDSNRDQRQGDRGQGIANRGQGQAGGQGQRAQQAGQGVANRGQGQGERSQGGTANRAGVANNVFSDKDGNVFRQGQTGNWERNSGGNNWQQHQGSGSDSQKQNLDRESQARKTGQNRYQNFQSGGQRSAGSQQRSYSGGRSYGGGFRNGGGGGARGGGGGRK